MRNILALLLICSSILIAGISNAETVTVGVPPTYTDGGPIVGDVIITVYTGGTCSGTVYGTATRTLPPTPPSPVSVSGASLAVGTYSFVANARVGTGLPGGCSAPFSYTWAGVVVVGPSAVDEKTSTATYSTTACTSPVWSVTPTTYASISTGGVLTTLDVPSNQTVTVKAACGTDSGTKTVTITNIASTTPGAPSITNIVR